VRRIVSGVTASLAFIDAALRRRRHAAGAPRPVLARPGRPPDRLAEAERVRRLLAHGINLFAYHLPLDAHAELGNNAQLGLRLGLAADARFGDQDLGFIGPAPERPRSLAALAQTRAQALGRARWCCRATAGRCAAWPGAPAVRRATSRPPSPPAPTPS
jgi:putative NIF3 family GTP cyclohydrolase 1 type 2